jgi:hypothetical protein
MTRLILFVLTFVAVADGAMAQSPNAMRDFYQCATQAGTSNRWQAIEWQQSMDSAKALAARQNKPILIVLHNNFGGDNSSHDC